MKTKLFLAGLLFFITGCATGTSLQNRLNSHIGQSIITVISDDGAPNSEMPLPNGFSLYVYKRLVPINAFATFGASLAHNSTPMAVCEIDYFVNSKGIIRGWKYKGNCH